MAFWELFPTIDHIHPVARGGQDGAENWVTTSMLRNLLKSHWTLQELGWKLETPGKLADWDGKMGWFVKYVERNEHYLEVPYIKAWFGAAQKVKEAWASN